MLPRMKTSRSFSGTNAPDQSKRRTPWLIAPPEEGGCRRACRPLLGTDRQKEVPFSNLEQPPYRVARGSAPGRARDLPNLEDASAAGAMQDLQRRVAGARGGPPPSRSPVASRQSPV